jgi:nucleoside-triphosphatase THEP1
MSALKKFEELTKNADKDPGLKKSLTSMVDIMNEALGKEMSGVYTANMTELCNATEYKVLNIETNKETTFKRKHLRPKDKVELFNIASGKTTAPDPLPAVFLKDDYWYMYERCKIYLTPEVTPEEFMQHDIEEIMQILQAQDLIGDGFHRRQKSSAT